MKLSDAVPGALCVLAGVGLAIHAAGFPRTAVQAYGPGFFPGLLGLLLAACGVLLVARGIAGRAAAPAGPSWIASPHAWFRVALVPACVLAWLWLGPRIGFLGAASIPTAIMLAILTRRPLLSVAVAAGSAIAVWVLFARVLLVPLPVGPLEALLP